MLYVLFKIQIGFVLFYTQSTLNSTSPGRFDHIGENNYYVLNTYVEV